MTVMLALWMLPTLATVEFLDIWYVPPVSMVLLFLLPVDSRRGETTLVRKDLQEGVSWNVLFLVVGGMAMVSGLTRLGVTDWMIGAAFAGNVAAPALPWLAGLLTTVLTQVGSGISATVMVSSMLFPIADTAGRHSHSRPLAVGCRSPRLGAASRLLADRSWGGADARRRLLRVRHRPALRGRASLGRQGSALVRRGLIVLGFVVAWRRCPSGWLCRSAWFLCRPWGRHRLFRQSGGSPYYAASRFRAQAARYPMTRWLM